jgi:integrase
MARRIVKPRKTALPQRTIRNVKEPGRHAMGNNLYLSISRTKSGGLSRRWVFLYRAPGTGRQREMGFGAADKISSEEAMARAVAAQKLLQAGVDPLDQKAATSPGPDVRTFRQDAIAFLEINVAKKNLKPSSRAYWEKCVSRFPALMSKAVAAVTESDVLATLENRPDHAKQRIFNMLRRILKWSLAQNHIERNPVDYQLSDKIPIAAVDPNKHLPSMDWLDLPAFVAQLRENNSLASLCVQLIILCANRNSEGREAPWSEFTTTPSGESIWTIPGERMKEGLTHVIPLSQQALDVLERLPRNGPLLFPAPRNHGASISDAAIQRLIPKGVTLHGFRASFASWAADHSYSIQLIDCALAHIIGGTVTRSYVRGTLLAERKPLMQKWADFLDSKTDHDAHCREFRMQERIASSEIVSKANFAELVGLERSTLTMMLKRGAIGGAALVGEGPKAKINVEIAKDQLRQNCLRLGRKHV